MSTQTPPLCVGFIMDGNRRWAKEKGIPTFEGHRAGFTALEHMIEAVRSAEIPHMVCYAFSTENWNRTPEEVGYLMELFSEGMQRLEGMQNEKGVQCRFIGERERFSETLQKDMERIEKSARETPVLTVWIALSYGGRREIVEAVNRAVRKGEPVTEKSFESLLSTSGMPDPDLIIRTGGEKRLSNFLPWQSVYSEFFFADTYWPDFGEVEFRGILESYGKRIRRRGK